MSLRSPLVMALVSGLIMYLLRWISFCMRGLTNLASAPRQIFAGIARNVLIHKGDATYQKSDSLWALIYNAISTTWMWCGSLVRYMSPPGLPPCQYWMRKLHPSAIQFSCMVNEASKLCSPGSIDRILGTWGAISCIRLKNSVEHFFETYCARHIDHH